MTRKQDVEVPDVLVLAAVERAARHHGREKNDVPGWVILEHLDMPQRSAEARVVRARLGVLEERGSLARSRRHGTVTWALTSSGRRRLQRARRAGDVPALAESPQHRAWRNARTAAGQEIDRFLQCARASVDDAIALLDADPGVGSDAWFELGERLHRDCRRVGSATYCLREWAEPDDARPDVDDHHDPADEGLDPPEQARRVARRAGRRNITLWATPAPTTGGER